jgi:hypothetical protein
MNNNQKKLEKIKLEKINRNYNYTLVNTLISRVSYFDFFSIDVFKTLIKANKKALIFKRPYLISELLFLTLLSEENELKELFSEFNLSTKKLERLLSKEIKSFHLSETLFDFRTSLEANIFKTIPSPSLRLQPFTFEMHNLFERAAENAFIRFKTPVINSSILFLTLMEDNKLIRSNLIENIIPKDTNWFLIRFKLLKKLHSQENSARLNSLKQQQFFTYLLKTQISDSAFSYLIKKQWLSNCVQIFRNFLVKEILPQTLVGFVDTNILNSVNKSHNRQYRSY